MKNTQENTRIQQKQLSFKPVNVYCCPRFYKGLIVADGRSPLSKYIPQISANNCNRIIQDDSLEKDQISNFGPQDGLMYALTKMAKNKTASSIPFGQASQKNQFIFKGIKMLICICMYNESRGALQTSLNGIYQNLPILKSYGVTQHDIAVVLLQDGILKLVKDPVKRTFQKGKNSIISFYRDQDKREGKEKCYLQQRIHVILDQIDNFSRKRMQDLVQNNNDFPPSLDKNVSLVYQNLWSPQQYQNKSAQPIKLKLLSCFKHRNGTKLSSHLWFFQGFCRQFNPQICVLLDVGTKPSQYSLLKYLQAFQDKNVGGVTGFMSIDANFASQEGDQQEQNQNCCKNAFLSIQKAQQFQYVISHFIDKNFESSLGFLHVLPGAWSAYRYQALIHGQKFQQNLLERKYFKMILDPSHQQRDYRQANMYLAQDRILSLGIYCQHDRKFYLKYVPDAVAYTDPMKSHQQLMVQRRRWINSSYFAFFYVFRNFYYNAVESKHNFIRKYIALIFNMVIALISSINGYLTPAFYFFALYTTIVQSGSNYIIQYAAQLMAFLYIFMVILCVSWSLHGTQWTKHAHIISYIFSFYTLVLMSLVIWNVTVVYLQLDKIQSFDEIFLDFQGALVFIMTCINILAYFVLAFLHLPSHPYFVCRLAIDSISYLAYQGAYSHVMLIYAFCNVDDVSWGTKGNKGKKSKKYLNDKVLFVANWLLYNAVLAFIFIYVDFFTPRQTKKGIMLLSIGVYATSILFIKVSLACLYQLKWFTFQRCCSRLKVDEMRNMKLSQFWQKCFEDYKANKKNLLIDLQSQKLQKVNKYKKKMNK